MTAFHPITVTTLQHDLAGYQRDLGSFQDRLERVTKGGANPDVVQRYSDRIGELTAVTADLAELLRLIAQHDTDAAEQDRQIAESYRAEAWRREVHVGLSDEQLAALACGSVYPAVAS